MGRSGSPWRTPRCQRFYQSPHCAVVQLAGWFFVVALLAELGGVALIVCEAIRIRRLSKRRQQANPNRNAAGSHSQVILVNKVVQILFTARIRVTGAVALLVIGIGFGTARQLRQPMSHGGSRALQAGPVGRSLRGEERGRVSSPAMAKGLALSIPGRGFAESLGHSGDVAAVLDVTRASVVIVRARVHALARRPGRAARQRLGIKAPRT